jgi:hypothetical protein
VIMIDRSRRLSEPLHWGRREKTAVAAVLACLVLVAAALLAYALSSGSPSRADCVNVTFPSTLGGAELHACGARARQVCGSGAFPGLGHELRSACRDAGFAYRGS